MKTLLIDIETAPNMAYVWGLWKQDIPLPMLVKPSYMLCFAAKWHGDPQTSFWSLQDGKDVMLDNAWALLNQADAVVHYNGKEFDIPILFQEFLAEDMPPPSPFTQIDLKKVVSKKFRLPSNKLQYVSDNLLRLGGKEETGGFSTWLGVMNNDEQAWEKFETYNRRDVTVLEEVYDKLLPWIDSHPNRNLFQETQGCPNCGSTDLVKEGFAYTAMGKFQRYSCRWCGRWSRDTKRLDGVAYVGAR